MLSVIWVPDSGHKDISNEDGQGVPRELQLFLCGFSLLLLHALAGTAWMQAMREYAETNSVAWVLQPLALIPGVAFAFQNIGATLGAIKSNSSIVKRLGWWAAVQAIAVTLFTLGSLH